MFSQEALLKATRNKLQVNLAHVRRKERSIQIMVDEQVPPTAGGEFIAVYGDSVVNLNDPIALTKKIEHGLTVAITRRVEGSPNENAGRNILTEDQFQRIIPSMLSRADQIVSLIDAQWDLITAANQIIQANSIEGCFSTTLGFSSIELPVEKVQTDHFDAEQEFTNVARYVGLVLRIQFAGAMFYRLQQPALA